MYRQTTPLRRGLAVLLLAGLAVFAAPAALAAPGCNPNGYQVSPKNQNNILEFDAANDYNPNLVHLGISKALDAGAVPTWSQLSGPAVSLDTTDPLSPTFLTPNVPAAGATLSFRLTVTCPDGSNGSNDGTVSVINVNRPPVAYASAAPPIVYAGDAVTLHSYAPAGSPVSNDPDGDSLTYLWTRTAGPVVTLANATTPTATFTAPVTGGSYTLQFQLRISDKPTGGLISTAAVVVNVTGNLPPIARLVCPDHVNELGHVLLDGSSSSDPNGGALTYQWTQLQGSPGIAVGGETGDIVQFNAPLLTTGQDGLLEFQLKVTDNSGLFDLATCMTLINDVTAPVITVPANITAEATSAAGAIVDYDASAQDAVDDAAPRLLACIPPSGSAFPLAAPPTQQKTTAVACTATDTAGNTATAGFNVTVRDTTPPLITVPGSVGVEATGPNGAIATFSAPTSDAVDGAGSATCVPASGSSFALGTTAVACNAADARGNAAAPAGFNLTVHDTTAPVIAAHDDVIAEATGVNGASVSYVRPGTSDLVDGSGTATCAPASSSTFALGTTAVDCNATDAAGNDALATTFNVIVRDTIPPAIAAHANVTAEATGPDGANVDYVSPATSDLVDGSGTATCLPAAGSLFQLGSTTVTCTAEDAAHNLAAPTTFTIDVVDTTPPTIDPHAAIDDVEATGPGGATVAYESPATHDLVDGDGTATCTPASGSLFALGGTMVTCQAEDAAHNHAAATMFAVNVVDTTPPAIEAHDAVGPIEATGAYGAHVDYTSPGTHDAVDGDGAAACLPVSGSAFGLGLNTVTCNAADHAGNAATPITFTIEVVDTTPPAIATHADVGPIEAAGPGGAVVAYTLPSTSDAVDGPGTASCLPASGSTFALGTNLVTCHATDVAGNHALATTFRVTVHDTTAPVIAAHVNIVAEATGPGGASVGYAAPATTDAVDGAGTASCAPASGSTFSLGATTVSCNAVDAAGNHAAGTSFTVTVRDTTAPAIAPHADVNVVASSNSSAVAAYTTPTATDLVDNTVIATCTPASGSTFNAGATTVNCSATDHAGNTATSSFKVNVSYAFNGFLQPVDNASVNTAKAGSAIPVKFGLGGNQGLNVFATNSPASVDTAQCDGSATDEVEVTVTAGSSSLSYDPGANQYTYVWKTEKNWIGCRQLRMTFKDGSVRTAMFKFR
jgi:hypothetical protein